jgi:hypothetical protein
MRIGPPIVIAALACAGAALAQTDPFGALYKAPAKSPQGATSVTGAVGRSYAGSRTGGMVSLAQLDLLPAEISPFPVPLDGYSTRYLKLRPRVAVPHYAVAFTQATKSSASGAGAGSDITPRRTTIATRLYGFTDAMGQAFANEAHRDLLAQLEAAGFEAVTPEAVQANSRYALIARHDGPFRVNAGHAGWTAYGPQAAPLIRGYAIEQGMGAMAASSAILALGHASKELDAVLLLPRLLIDYAAVEGTGHATYRGNAQVEVELKFAINPQSRTDYIAGNERGGAMPGGWSTRGYTAQDPFAILVKADDRSDSAALHNAFATAGFGSIYRQSLIYDAEISPRRFSALTRAAYRGYNAALVAELKRARGL